MIGFTRPFLAVLAALALGGFVLWLTLAPQPRTSVPDFTAAGLSRADLPPETVLMNFFASWCIPCAAEHPVLTDLAGELPVYGIAFLDTPDKVSAFLNRLGNPYRQVGIDSGGTAGAAWGVGALPASFLIRDGKIIYRLDGPLTEEIVARDIRPLIDGP